MKTKIITITTMALLSFNSMALKTQDEIDIFLDKTSNTEATSYLYKMSDAELGDYIKTLISTSEDFTYNKEKSSISTNDIHLKEIKILNITEEPILIDSLDFSVDNIRKILLDEIDVNKLNLSINGVKIKIKEATQFNLPNYIELNVNANINKSKYGDYSQEFNFDAKELLRLSLNSEFSDTNLFWENMKIENEAEVLFMKNNQPKQIENIENQSLNYQYPIFEGHHPFMKAMNKGDSEKALLFVDSFYGDAKVDNYSFEFVNKGLIEKVSAIYPPFFLMKADLSIKASQLDETKLSKETKEALITFFKNPESISIKSDFQEKILISKIFEIIKKFKAMDSDTLTQEEKDQLSNDFFEDIVQLLPTKVEANTLKD